MNVLKKLTLCLSFVLFSMGTAKAAIVSTSEMLMLQDRTQLVSMLERKGVQQELIANGVDPVAALARVDQMTGDEITQLNGHINQLAVGAGVSTVELLLIIILVILVL